MKTIAFIDSLNNNVLDYKFNQITSNLIKHNNEKVLFFIYTNSEVYNHSNFSNKNVRYIKLPDFFKSVFMVFHSLFFADLLFIKGTKYLFILPFLKVIFRKKIILMYHENNSFFSPKKTIHFYISLLREFISVKFSDRIITNHEFTRDYLSAKYTTQIDYIENGGSHVERVESTFSDHIQYPFLKYMYAVSYYNDESSNYIETILQAFKQIKHKYLVVIGNWDCNEYSLMLKNKYSGYSNIFLLYPINDKRKRDLVLSNSILCIQSSPSVYLNNFLIESMSLKLPVLAYESVNNKFLTEGKASYYKNTIEIKNYIEQLSLEKMRKNAHSMYDIAYVRFNWDFIIKSYNKIIDQVLFPSNISNKTIFSDFNSNSLWNITSKNHSPKLSLLRTIYNIFL